MAITSVGTLGTGASSTAASSFSYTTSAQLDANNEGILVVSSDNRSTTDGNTNDHTSATCGGNAMTKLYEHTNSNAAAGGGVTVSVWKYRPASNIASGASVVVNFSGNITDKCASFWEFTSTNRLVKDPIASPNPVANDTDASNGFGSVSFSGLASQSRLYFRGLGKEANSTTTLTVSTSFTAITNTRSRNNASAVGVWGEFRINTSTGETSNPTLAVSGDTAGVFLALIEQTTTTKTLTGVSNIYATTSQILTGKARLTATTAQTTTGKSRLRVTTTQTNTGISSISKTTGQTITGKASIVSPLVADYIINKKATLSLRKTVAGYTGYCGRVQRASDNTTLDIGFVGNNLDTASISTFCSGTTGRWVRWYFQDKEDGSYVAPAGNGAVIYESGAIVTSNNRPALRFYLADPVKYEFPSGMLNGATELTYIHVAKITNHASSNSGVFAPTGTNSVGLEVLQAKVISLDTELRINGVQRVGGNGINLLFGDDVQSITEVYGDASSMSAYYNNSSVTMTDSSAMPSLNFNGVYALGGYSGAYYSGGYYQELIISETNNASNRGTYFPDLRTYWLTSTTTKTNSGLSRITKTSTQTINGVGRIGVTTTKNITSLAKIIGTTTKTLNGKAQINAINFFDDFDDNSISSAYYTLLNGGTITESGQKLNVTLPSTPIICYAGTSGQFNFTDREMVVDVNNFFQANLSSIIGFGSGLDYSNYVILGGGGGGYIQASVTTGGVGQSYPAFTTDATKLKIRHSSSEGALYFYGYSPTTLDWEFLGRLEISWDVTSVIFNLGGFNWGSVASPLPIEFDNFEIRAASNITYATTKTFTFDSDLETFSTDGISNDPDWGSDSPSHTSANIGWGSDGSWKLTCNTPNVNGWFYSKTSSTKTWEDYGVPSGAVVDYVILKGWKTKRVATTGVTSLYISNYSRALGTSWWYLGYSDNLAGATDGTYQPIADTSSGHIWTNVTYLDKAQSNSPAWFYFDGNYLTGSGTVDLDFRIDDVSFEIAYHFPSSNTITGKSKLQATTTKTLTGISNLSVSSTTTTKTIDGISRLINSSAHNINGISRITNSSSQSINGKSRITNTAINTTTGLARITKNTYATISAISRITNNQTKTLVGICRITNSSIHTINAIGRIQKSVASNITGLAKIGNSIGVVLTGVAKITNTQPRTILGLARISKSSLVTINSVSRIQKPITTTITGLVRIQKPITTTLLGQANLKLVGVRDIIGKAKIDADIAYSKDALTSLPSNNNNLANIYNSGQVSNTIIQDDVVVGLSGSGYLIHQFKVRTSDITKAIRINWKGYSTVSTSDRPVILQVYNLNSNVWETIGNNQNTSVGQLITINGTKGGTNISEYYDVEDYCYLRIYQFVGGNGAYFG